MGGDPFQQSNGAFQELQKFQYSYGMFQNNQAPMWFDNDWCYQIYWVSKISDNYLINILWWF